MNQDGIIVFHLSKVSSYAAQLTQERERSEPGDYCENSIWESGYMWLLRPWHGARPTWDGKYPPYFQVWKKNYKIRNYVVVIVIQPVPMLKSSSYVPGVLWYVDYISIKLLINKTVSMFHMVYIWNYSIFNMLIENIFKLFILFILFHKQSYEKM
jgi:hypothetical protein